MTPEDVTGYFTGADGVYRFARWGRPIVPVVFGVEDATLAVVKGAVEAVCAMAGHQMAETDPEFGANLMVFFLRGWAELAEVKDLGALVPELDGLLERLEARGANQYRLFRFDETGAIKACFVFLKMDDALAGMAAEDLALGQMVQVMLVWGAAFVERSPLAVLSEGGVAVLRPEIAAVVRAAYDPVMPVAADDASHGLRLFARVAL
ncbi:MAG: hypothetical protein ACU0CA_04745 [Paracoccaceae bacterium]